jgi:hypothetical protein
MATVVSGTAAGLLYTGACSVGAVTLVAGSAAATCNVTDATAAGSSDNIVAALAATAGTSASIPFHGVDASSGVYLQSISGSGATVIVELI